jgi:hypothetical protein
MQSVMVKLRPMRGYRQASENAARPMSRHVQARIDKDSPAPTHQIRKSLSMLASQGLDEIVALVDASPSAAYQVSYTKVRSLAGGRNLATEQAKYRKLSGKIPGIECCALVRTAYCLAGAA